MADRIRNHEKETHRANASSPSVEPLLDRLNQIDVLLRKLEEKERSPENYFTGDLRARSKPLLPAMNDVHLKQALMDRLQLLEAKILQLGNDLHQRSDSSYQALPFPTEKQKQIASSNSGRRMVGGKKGRRSGGIMENEKSERVCCCSFMLKRVLRWMRACILCTGDDHVSLNSSLSDDCEALGIHGGCYH